MFKDTISYYFTSASKISDRDNLMRIVFFRVQPISVELASYRSSLLAAKVLVVGAMPIMVDWETVSVINPGPGQTSNS